MTRTAVEGPSVGMEREARNALEDEAIARVEGMTDPTFRHEWESVLITVHDLRILLDLAKQAGGLRAVLEGIAKRTAPHPDDTIADTAKDALKAHAMALAALRPDQSKDT